MDNFQRHCCICVCSFVRVGRGRGFLRALWRYMVRDKVSGPSGPTGPKNFPKRVTLNLDDQDFLRELAGATGSETPVELMNLAISTLKWVIQSRKEGKKIYAMRTELPDGADAQELIVEVVDGAEED